MGFASALAQRNHCVQRERGFESVALFYMLPLDFATDSDRSTLTFLGRFVEVANCDELVHTSFTNRYSPTLVTTLRAILEDFIENRHPDKTILEGV